MRETESKWISVLDQWSIVIKASGGYGQQEQRLERDECGPEDCSMLRCDQMIGILVSFQHSDFC